MGPPVAQQVKNLPVMQETQEMQVLSLGQEDPLEEEMATHSSILAWRIPRTEEPGRLQSMGSQRVRHDWAHGKRKVIERDIRSLNKKEGGDLGKISVLEQKSISSYL